MKLLTLKFFILLVVLFIPNIVDSKELNSLKNLVIYEDQKKISEISFKNEKDKNVSLSKYENKLLDMMRCSYVSQGLYYKMFSAYLKYFDFSNFLVINFNSEVERNLEATVKKMSDFFKIDLSNINLDIHSNKSGKAKSKLLQELTLKNNFFRKILKFMIPQKNRQIIRNRIKNFNKDVYKYIPLSIPSSQPLGFSG